MTGLVHANGATIPAIGLGTWKLKGEGAIRSVQLALDAGYRHIDTAAMYGNEEQVGEAIRTHATPATRSFLTTKVWSSDLADGRLQNRPRPACGGSGWAVVDLLLIHWPSTTVPAGGADRSALQGRKQGLTAISGVQLPAGLRFRRGRLADEPIVTNQVEHHPYLDQSELMASCRQHGHGAHVLFAAWPRRLAPRPGDRRDRRCARETPAQIILRWHVQQPMNIAIPKSENPQRSPRTSRFSISN
jgi:diketogulonate reductase-like aldo/keto reductase